MSTIALFGATGAMGRSIAAALNRQGKAYRVVGRNEERLRRHFGADPLAEIAVWDPDSPSSIQAAAAGAETLIYTVGVDYWRFGLHPSLMHKTLEGAITAGVKRFVLISSVYSYGLVQTNPVREDHPREPHTFKGRMRKMQEDLLMQAHAEGRISATVLRLPDFFGPSVENGLLSMAARAAVNGGAAAMVGPIDVPHQFVYVPDVGPVVVRMLDSAAAFGRAWHFAGSGVVTQRELAEQMERETGRRLKLRVAGKTTLRLLGLFNPLMRELVEMHYLQTHPVILDDAALHGLLGNIDVTPYPEGIRQMLAAVPRHHKRGHGAKRCARQAGREERAGADAV